MRRTLLLFAAAALPAGFLPAEEPFVEEPAVTVAAPEPATSEEPESTPRKNPTWIEGRGLDFRTADGRFDLALGATLQVRYSHIDPEGLESANEFRIRRFKLNFTGWAFDPRLTYRFQLAWENVGEVDLLDDAWVAWKFEDLLQAQLGQSKTPYGREELIGDALLMFGERSIAIDAFKPSRDTGVMVSGATEGVGFQYNAGVFGGAGQSTVRTSSHVMPIARAVWSTFGEARPGEPDLGRSPKLRVSVGANGFFNTLEKRTPDSFESSQPSYATATGWLGQNVSLFQTGEDVEVGSGGVDFQAAWRGLSLLGEYLFGHARGETSGVSLNSRGYYVELGAMALPKLGLACRYSNVDSNRAATDDQQTEVNGAVTWYFRKHNAKLLLEYSSFHTQKPDRPANDRVFLVQAQLYF